MGRRDEQGGGCLTRLRNGVIGYIDAVCNEQRGRCGNGRSGDSAGLWRRAVHWLRRGRASQHDSLSNDERVFIVIQFLDTKLRLLYTAMASFRILVVSRVHGRLLHPPHSGIEESMSGKGIETDPVKGVVQVAAPQNALTDKGKEWLWTEECTQALLELKKRLVSAPTSVGDAMSSYWTLC
eukprot:Em0006g308a